MILPCILSPSTMNSLAPLPASAIPVTRARETPEPIPKAKYLGIQEATRNQGNEAKLVRIFRMSGTHCSDCKATIMTLTGYQSCARRT
jgi:hypothetical protein